MWGHATHLDQWELLGTEGAHVFVLWKTYWVVLSLIASSEFGLTEFSRRGHRKSFQIELTPLRVQPSPRQ